MLCFESFLLDVLTDRSPFTGRGNRTHVAVTKNLLTTEALYHSAHYDRSPFTGGGDRTHVAVPKNLLTTEALHHSATEVLIEFDKYFGSRVV